MGISGAGIRSDGGIRLQGLRTHLDRSWALVATVLSVGAGVVVALVASAGVRATTGASDATAALEGVARGAIAAIPVAVAMYAWRRSAHARFGKLLLAFSAVWFVASLSSSSSPLVYSVGRVAGWLAEAGIVYVLLAFPTGRLETRLDRALALYVLGVSLLYLPTALLVAQYPLPAPWVNCVAGCPHNAFMVLSHQPGFITAQLEPVRGVLTVLGFALVAVRLAARIRGSSTLLRRTVVPVLAVSSVRMLLFAPAIGLRQAAPSSPVTGALMWALAALVPAIAVAFLIGLLRWRLFVTGAMQRVHARLRGMPGPQQVRDVLAEAFEDPGLRIGYWLRKRHRWVTADGRPVDAPVSRSGRYLTEVREHNRRVVAILHDAELRDEPAFIEMATSLATMAFASDRLSARTAAMLRELTDSRARVAAAADSERRRIERDIHDGAQQRLVALRIQLELAAENTEPDNPREAADLRELGEDVDRALEEIRSLAHGIYPAVLTDRGLAEALRSAARRSPVPTTVHSDELSVYPLQISTAVYLCCVEALQNVAKHAHGASGARIVLEQNDSVLRFSVSDDGAGFSASQAGAGVGITNMRDRVATVGGELSVHSRPRHGTRVLGQIPLSCTEPLLR